MRSDLVVVLSPAFDEYLGFLKGVEDFEVEQFISELAVEGFDIAVFPRTARLDE